MKFGFVAINGFLGGVNLYAYASLGHHWFNLASGCLCLLVALCLWVKD